MVKKILYIIAIFLFCFNYKICDLFYYNDDIKDIKLWWGLKARIYDVVIFLVFWASLIDTKKWLKFILSLAVGLSLSSLIDKIYFDVFEFNQNDIVMIIITVCFSVLSYLKDKNNWRK